MESIGLEEPQRCLQRRDPSCTETRGFDLCINVTTQGEGKLPGEPPARANIRCILWDLRVFAVCVRAEEGG